MDDFDLVAGDWCAVKCAEIPVGNAPDYYRRYDENDSLSDYDGFYTIMIIYQGSRVQVFKGFWGYTRRYEYGLMWHSSQNKAEEPVFSIGQQMIYYHSKEMEARFRSICDISVVSEAFYQYQIRSRSSEDPVSEGPGSEGPRKRAKYA